LIFIAGKQSTWQRVPTESLGEMERKRSYQRDTVVLALPVLMLLLTLRDCKQRWKIEQIENWTNPRKGWESGMDALRSKRRATGRVHALSPITTYSRPEVRKRVIGSVTVIDSRLKTQRATAMPNAA
jgi:hypothetical protein